ncbi:MAG: hypothetical protein RLZZ224_1766 [Verrucomicrobiota bacterium]|jgi:hypothetical protein
MGSAKWDSALSRGDFLRLLIDLGFLKFYRDNPPVFSYHSVAQFDENHYFFLPHCAFFLFYRGVFSR